MKKSTSLFAKIMLRDQRTVVIYYRNRRWPTGISVGSPKEFKNNILTADYSGPEDYNALNKYLAEKLHFFNKLIIEALRENRDTLDYIDCQLKREERKLKNLKVTNNTLICEAFEDYLKIKKNTFDDFKKPRSFQRYLSELSRLKDFQKLKRVTISEIDMDWILSFTRFLSKPYTKTFDVNDSKNERSYTSTKVLTQTNSTIKRFVQDIITFLKFLNMGQPELSFPIKEMTIFMNDLKCRKNYTDDIITLTDHQYDAIMNFQPKLNRPWEIDTLNLFRFCLQTGLRYSDVVNLNDVYVNNENIIIMKAVKTDCLFKVPMNKTAIDIFNKYGRDFRNRFPKNQQINKNLRKILKQIPEFNIDQNTYQYILGVVTPIDIKAYNQISFHASRRTFVSRAIRKRATLDQIKKWTGWIDLRTLTYYLEVFGNNYEDDLAILN